MDSGGTSKLRAVDRMAVGSQVCCKGMYGKGSRRIKYHSSKQNRYFWIARFDTINPHAKVCAKVRPIWWSWAVSSIKRSDKPQNSPVEHVPIMPSRPFL